MNIYTKTTRITGTKFSESIGKNGYRLPIDLDDVLDRELSQWYSNEDIQILNVSIQSIFDIFETDLGLGRKVMCELPVVHWLTIIYKHL